MAAEVDFNLQFLAFILYESPYFLNASVVFKTIQSSAHDISQLEI